MGFGVKYTRVSISSLICTSLYDLESVTYVYWASVSSSVKREAVIKCGKLWEWKLTIGLIKYILNEWMILPWKIYLISDSLI